MTRLPFANKTMLITFIDKRMKWFTEIVPCSRVDLYSENKKYILKVHTKCLKHIRLNSIYQFRLEMSNDPDLDNAGDWMSLGTTSLRIICDIVKVSKKDKDYFMLDFYKKPHIIKHKAQRGYIYED